MNPHNHIVSELLLVADQAEREANTIRVTRDAGGNVPFGTCEDHRAEVLGNLLDAIDRTVPGLGTRLQAAMYPLTTEEQVPA